MNIRDAQIVKKILSEITVMEDLILGYTLDRFLEDEKTKRAVCMTLINIGELSKNITDEFRKQTSHISWKGITGMRDITAHKYQTLKIEDVWYTIEIDIPKLKKQLEELSE